MNDKKLHYVVPTAIIVKDKKYLIAQRSLKEKAFPGRWTVPGGKTSIDDYINLPKDTPDSWYNIVEKVLYREIEEEVDLKVDKPKYLCDLAFIRPDGIPVIVLSYWCFYKTGKVKLCDDLIDYKWVTAEEAKKYDLTEGIGEEIKMVDKILKGENGVNWKGKYA